MKTGVNALYRQVEYRIDHMSIIRLPEPFFRGGHLGHLLT